MKKVRLFYNDNKGNIEKVAYIEAKWSTLFKAKQLCKIPSNHKNVRLQCNNQA